MKPERLLRVRYRVGEMIMLRRTLAVQWFNGLIVELSKYKSREVIAAVPEKHESALDHLKEIDKQQVAEDEKE